MNITDYQRSSAHIIIGTATNSLAFGGVTISSNATGAAGSVLVATSSNSAIWRDAIAFGSNSNDVSAVSTGGSSSSNSRADHTHRGLSSLSHSSNTFYAGITLTTPGNSVGITSPSPGTLAFTARQTSGGSGVSDPSITGAAVGKTTNTSYTAGGMAAALACNAESFDSSAFHDNASNNTRITIPSGFGGAYRLEFFGLVSPAVNSLLFGTFRKNGTTTLGNGSTKYASTADQTFHMSVPVVELVDGDYVELLLQAVTADCLLYGTGTYAQQFAVVRPF